LLDDCLRREAKLVLSREPSPHELSVLRGLFQKTIGSSGGAALKPASFKSFEDSVAATSVSRKEFEAYKTVASVLLNLDAALTR